MIYEVGDLARSSVTFTDIDGNQMNPSVVTLTVLDPTGASSAAAPIINDSTGVYHYDLNITLSGTYRLRWVGQGSLQAAIEGAIVVAPTSLVQPSAIDLVTVPQVTQWFPITDLSDLANIQLCITSASRYWLWRTGRDPGDGAIPTASSLVTPVALNECYDGAGGDRQFVRIWPIQSVQALTIDNQTIQPSTNALSPGYVVDQGKRSIALRQTGNGWNRGFRGRSCFGYKFNSGIQNVNIQYTAGFYGTPFDIQEKCIEMVVLNFKRRNWVDQRSNAKPETIGSVVYRDWELPPGIVSVMENYTRRAIV